MNRNDVGVSIGASTRVWGVLVLLGLCAYGQSTAGSETGVAKGRVAMSDMGLIGTTKHVTGAFEVKMAPQPAEAEGGAAMRMLLDKTYHGALEATAKGQMLAAGTTVKESAGYVAIEFVGGTLDGQTGSFALQHTGTMNRGVPTLSVTVVPDSGTGELTGLTGKMDIVIAEGKHTYVFDYTLPASQE